MGKNKKIKTFLSVLLVFLICIFNQGFTEDCEIPEDAGWSLFPSKSNMGSATTSYSYDDKPLKYEIIEDGISEEFEKRAIDYKDYVEKAITMWNDTAGGVVNDDNYEIINMEELESGGMGTIKLAYNEDKGNAWVNICYMESDTDKKITNWTLTINTYWFEKKNSDGSDFYDYEDKVKTIAHEIGHVFGLADLKDTNNYSQIMYYRKNPSKSITANDIQGMEVVTESFTSDEWVPVATEDRCTNHVYTTRSGGEFILEHKDTHSYIDESYITCPDCGHMRNIEIPIINIGELLVARIDGQSWVLNQPTSLFSNLAGYSSCYNLPRGGTLCWNDISDIISYNQYDHEYCYNYNGTNYIYGDSAANKHWEESFKYLRQLTEIRGSKGSYHYLSYVLSRKWSLHWYPQYVETEKNLYGIFWAELQGSKEEGYYLVTKRGLVDKETADLMNRGEVWSPELRIPVYFSGVSDYQTPAISLDGTIDLSSEIIKSIVIDGYNPEVTFMLKWPGSDLDLTLKGADGTVIDPELALSDPNIDYIETDTYEFYRIFEPASGQWEAVIEAVDVEGEEPYTLEVFGKASEIPVNPTELVLDFPYAIQYSDMLSGKATLTSKGELLEGMEVEFGCMLPQETLITDENGEVYSSPYKVIEPAGTKDPVCVNFYGNNNYLSSYSKQYIEIEKENAFIAYSGDTIVEVGSPVTLSCEVAEEPDESPGDITLAGQVSFSLTTEEGFYKTYTADVDSGDIVIH